MTRWSDDPALAEIWNTPDTDVLAEMQARTDALLARLHDERGPLVAIDAAGLDAWIASRDREHDVTEASA